MPARILHAKTLERDQALHVRNMKTFLELKLRYRGLPGIENIFEKKFNSYTLKVDDINFYLKSNSLEAC